MKKYLIISVALILSCTAWLFIRDRFTIFFNWSGQGKQTVAVNFYVKDKEIYHLDEQEPFEVRGVALDTSLPGHYATDFTIDKETYLRWLDLIDQMGANTVKVPTIMNSDFYDAFYEYNKNREEPLYLLQSLWVTDYAQDAAVDARSKEFEKQLKADSREVIDVIHGNKLLAYSKTKGNGWYTKDVSAWVLGIVLGNTWNGETVAYTNHLREDEPLYQGKYFSASKEASPFESMLAELLDDMTAYENEKYRQQHMVSVIGEPTVDPFTYEKLISFQLGKYDCVDTEHIVCSESAAAGFFTSYRLYDFCERILEYLTEEEQLRLSDILPVESYAALLEKYHSTPVVIADYGYSSSRGITRQGDRHGLTEREQGEALVETYEECRRLGMSGVVISSWQEAWYASDWNINPMLDREKVPFWYNVQSETQGYGLLEMAPGEDGPKVVVDGRDSEWQGTAPVVSNETGALYVQQDEGYLYLMLQRKEEDTDKAIYIPFDVTPVSGSTYSKEQGIRFERDADFLLVIEGENARLLVQEYYDPARAAWLMEMEHRDAYTGNIPDKDSADFAALRMIVSSEPVLSYDWHKKEAAVVDTGMMRYGNADPNAAAYDSRADFYTAGTCTEIRIPWLLLNFMDPSEGKIHDDYYEHYGIQGRGISEIYLGLGSEGQEGRIFFSPYRLQKWKHAVTWHERLKQSYEVVKERWNVS